MNNPDHMQRARELLATELAGMPGMRDMADPVLHARGDGPFTAAALRAIAAALSEAQGRETPEWLDDVKRCLSDISQEHGHVGRGNRRFEALLSRINATRWQAEPAAVVDEATLERGLRAAEIASDARLPRHKVVHAILTAALTGDPT